MDATMTAMTSSLGSRSLGGVAQADLSKMLPPQCYTQGEWFERELQAIHFPAWHFVCLSSSIPDTGSFVTRRFLERSVIVVRSEDGTIRAFLNSCRHRAAPLTTQKCGKNTQFKCPFHEWTYDTSGNLISAPGLGGCVTRSDLPGLKLNLVSVQCEVTAGLVFINLNAENEVPLDAYLGNYIDKVALPHQIQRMHCVQEKAYTLTTNWKLYIEVDMETLHTNFIHSRSIGSQPVRPIEHDRNWFGVYHKNSLSPALFPEKRNLAFSPPRDIIGEAAEGTHFCVILPGFFIVTAPEVMWWIQKTPISATRTSVNVGYAFHEETLARSDFNDIAPLYFERLDQVILEDDQICEYQLEGLSNQVQGHYTPVEPIAAYFSALVGSRLREAGYE
ncbi:phenylpropionate dioxygenase-like ring-hydroxylating dioxygenase large terminal subunit [Marinobacter sp. MBR-99]|uniref:aromatic ring-hydroxylating oxygenase subunit alpha n=1 Tax=Marinobacter sp. MBR-99 TaxID=3156461 RepID=UPI003394A0B9